MAHVVISVSPETKKRIDVLRDGIEKEEGYRLSYSDIVKMLLKTYEDGKVVREDSQQMELGLGEDKSDIFERYKG
jgi:hypothetical protein|tara:strand:- start:242 stop:466 length:225 start_codon:yes stop_codon:yes gene_type:complete